MRRLILIPGAALLNACLAAPPHVETPLPLNDDAAVYAAALDSLVPAGNVTVVRDSTLTLPEGAPVLNDVSLGLMDADAVMRTEFRERSRASGPVPPLRLPGRRVEMVGGVDVPWDVGGWRAFAARHLDAAGYYELSAIGRTADRRWAILYLAHRCGSERCGTSWLVRLARRPGGGWRVQAARALAVR